MIRLILPDNSSGAFDTSKLRFTAFRGDALDHGFHISGLPDEPRHKRVDGLMLAERFVNPKWRFGDCFRRIPDTDIFSPKRCVHDFDVHEIKRIYNFPRKGTGGMFSSSDSYDEFLDGYIHYHAGYGFRAHFYSTVCGLETLRAVCLFHGIEQPLRLKGERECRPLAALLEEMTGFPLRVW